MANMRFSVVMGITFAVTSIAAIFGCSPETIRNNDVLQYLSNASKLFGCRGCNTPDSEVTANELAESFDVADADNNGLLSLAEAQTVFIALTEAEFAALDINGDGFLSREELNVRINPNEAVEGESIQSEITAREQEDNTAEGETVEGKEKPRGEVDHTGDLVINLPGDVPLAMMRIPAGKFVMGRYPGELAATNREAPQHLVTLSQSFYMGKYEVTQQQWLAVMGSWPETAPSSFNGLDNNYPAYYVSWEDAQNFIKVLNTHITNTGQGPARVRLPSEAEWEYACRAGTTTRFYWGDDSNYTQIDSFAWYRGNNIPHGVKPVGGKLPNAFGLYDMSGNLLEYCEDDWHIGYKGAPMDGSAWVDDPRGQRRVSRGGDCFNDAQFCRSAYHSFASNNRCANAGFRIACTLYESIREFGEDEENPVEDEGKPIEDEEESLEGKEQPEGEVDHTGDLVITLPDDVPLSLIHIPAGTFMMGRDIVESEEYHEEFPRHKVTISQDFYLGKYELTKRQWIAVMGTTPWLGSEHVIDDLDSPAVCISWKSARDFIARLNTSFTNTEIGTAAFRLPSEAEWEYACRAGTTTRNYWGDDPEYTLISDYAWWYENARENNEGYAHIVGLKLPNAFGLYDMVGNASEWCQDLWHENYIGAPTDGNAWESDQSSIRRVRRSPSCRNFSINFNSTYRYGSCPSDDHGIHGFRVSCILYGSDITDEKEKRRNIRTHL